MSLTDLAKKFQDPDSLLKPAEAGVYLQCSKFYLANLRSRGEGPPYVKLGARVFYRPKDLKKYVDESVINPNEAS